MNILSEYKALNSLAKKHSIVLMGTSPTCLIFGKIFSYHSFLVYNKRRKYLLREVSQT